MIKKVTLDTIRAVLRTDSDLSPADQNRLMALLRTGGITGATPAAPVTPEPRILRRAEVASRLSCSKRAVDVLGSQGLLPRILWPGRKRSAGYRESDVNAFIAGRE